MSGVIRGRMTEDKTKKRAMELERVLGELYQILGSLADYAGVYEHPDVQRALDNAARGRMVHTDLLPWPKTPLPTPAALDALASTPQIDTGIDVDAMSIKQFCQRYGISESFFYKMQREGKAPRTFKFGGRKMITVQAAADWVRARENESN
jgi:predicted DNA-binding transcriptional regulator AlpA